MLQLNWIRAQAGNWLDPLKTEWTSVSGRYGVYVIWSVRRGLFGSHIVRVGQGSIADRVRHHMLDPEIRAFGELRFAFAEVSHHHVDAVEAYLGNRLRPMVGQRFPKVVPIEVNLPLFTQEQVGPTNIFNRQPRRSPLWGY